MNGLSLVQIGILVADDDDGSYVGVSHSFNSGASNVIDLVEVNPSEVNASVVVEADDLHVLSTHTTIGSSINKGSLSFYTVMERDTVSNKLMFMSFSDYFEKVPIQKFQVLSPPGL